MGREDGMEGGSEGRDRAIEGGREGGRRKERSSPVALGASAAGIVLCPVGAI